MRFCPFCAQENADAASDCAHCGRKLPQIAAPPSSPQMPAAVRPPPPRRVPRPIPRTRPVTPLPATEKAQPAPEAPAAPMETHGSARARSGTLLGIPATTPASPSAPFELPTEPTEAVPASLLSDNTSPSERIDVGYDEPQMDTQVSLPPLHTPVTAPAAPTVRAPMPPVPLPPPPGHVAQSPMRLDPTSGETLLPEVQPIAPVVSEPIVLDRTDVPDPIAMPMHPPAGIWPAVRYLLPLARAVWDRHKKQTQLRTLLHDDQRRVDEALRDLGEAAWHMRPRPPELRSELDRADDDDTRRKSADQEIARLDMSVAAEKERFAADERARLEDLSRREAEVVRVGNDLAERKRAQKTEEKALREIEARMRNAQKEVQSHESAAQKAETTPPEKGGGPNAAANAREKAALAQREVDGIRPDLDTQAQKVTALDEPIAQLDAQLQTERTGVATAKSDLDAAKRAHGDTLGTLEVERTQQADVKKAAERAVRLRLVSTGTLLSLHRLDAAEHQPKFAPIYARLDELQGVASARDARIGALESERHGYDRAAVQRGIIALGAAVGVVAIVLVVLIVLVARH